MIWLSPLQRRYSQMLYAEWCLEQERRRARWQSVLFAATAAALLISYFLGV